MCCETHPSRFGYHHMTIHESFWNTLVNGSNDRSSHDNVWNKMTARREDGAKSMQRFQVSLRDELKVG